MLLAQLGTALTTSPEWLLAFVAIGSYFIWSAVIEERITGTLFKGA
jgi:hypothetical protein